MFNTLNNIYALAVARSEKTPQMVLRLSELLRYVVYETKENQILLTKEIAHLEQYLALFQLRNETPQNLSFIVKGNPEGLSIEPMILIPLVENCCKHGDFDYNEHAFAEIELSVVEGWLHFSTRNSKNDQNHQKDQVSGVGLDNIRRRLVLKYPHAHQFDISQTEREFTVHLSIQLAKHEK